jgi:hypothetical protein
MFLKAGWYGLRNRRASEQEISDEERDTLEKEFFASEDWRDLDSSKLGRYSLKNALIKMRNDFIKQSVPGVELELNNMLSACKSQISDLGESRHTNHEQYNLVNKIATEYSWLSCNALAGHYRILGDNALFIRKLIRENLDCYHAEMVGRGLKKPFSTCDDDARIMADLENEATWLERTLNVPMYAWINEEIEAGRATEFSGEANPEVRNILWKAQTESWEEISYAALHVVEQTVEKLNQALFEKVCPDQKLRVNLQKWLSADFQAATKRARDELAQLLQDERADIVSTRNIDHLKKRTQLRSERTAALLKALARVQPAIGSRVHIPSSINERGSYIEPTEILDGHLYSDPSIAVILNEHDTLAAYYDIAMNRFVDNVCMQVVERHLLGRNGPFQLFSSEYVSRKLYGKDNEAQLRELTSEGADKLQERLDLNAKRESLEAAKTRIEEFKLM